MPGYKQSELFAPQPTEATPDMKRRFVVPRFTMIQWIIMALVAYVGFQYKNLNKPVTTTIMFAIALLHMYDHLFLVQRGDERLFFLPGEKKEGYCAACQK